MLTLNPEKCTVLRIGSKNPKREYILKGVVVRKVREQLDLGVTVTEDLKWESHINKIMKFYKLSASY